MTDYLAAIPLLAIPRLRCPKCRTRMRLARISPGSTGFEVSTFECSTCDHVEQIAIASDPMKSGDVGWLVGELQPPTYTMPPPDAAPTPRSKTIDRVLSLVAAFIVVAIMIVARY